MSDHLHPTADDPATWKIASQEDKADKAPSDKAFIEQFCREHNVVDGDREDLMEYLEREADRILSEKFIKILNFFDQCTIPKLVVFAALATDSPKNMVEIAEQCGVSKQAVHNAFRAMEPRFAATGAKGFLRRRQFRTQTQDREVNEEAYRDIK